MPYRCHLVKDEMATGDNQSDSEDQDTTLSKLCPANNTLVTGEMWHSNYYYLQKQRQNQLCFIPEELYSKLNTEQISIYWRGNIFIIQKGQMRISFWFCKMCMQWRWCYSCTKSYTTPQKAGHYKRGKSAISESGPTFYSSTKQQVNKWTNTFNVK